jgi:hypothetical protein
MADEALRELSRRARAGDLEAGWAYACALERAGDRAALWTELCRLQRAGHPAAREAVAAWLPGVGGARGRAVLRAPRATRRLLDLPGASVRRVIPTDGAPLLHDRNVLRDGTKALLDDVVLPAQVVGDRVLVARRATRDAVFVWRAADRALMEVEAGRAPGHAETATTSGDLVLLGGGGSVNALRVGDEVEARWRQPLGTVTSPLAVHGDAVAWVVDRRLHVHDLATGELRLQSPPVEWPGPSGPRWTDVWAGARGWLVSRATGVEGPDRWSALLQALDAEGRSVWTSRPFRACDVLAVTDEAILLHDLSAHRLMGLSRADGVARWEAPVDVDALGVAHAGEVVYLAHGDHDVLRLRALDARSGEEVARGVAPRPRSSLLPRPAVTVGADAVHVVWNDDERVIVAAFSDR